MKDLNLIAESNKQGIQYVNLPTGNIQVRKSGKAVGVIKSHPKGVAYYPLGNLHKGKTFASVDEVKRSLLK